MGKDAWHGITWKQWGKLTCFDGLGLGVGAGVAGGGVASGVGVSTGAVQTPLTHSKDCPIPR